MLSNAYTWIERNPIGLMIGLVSADHVNFVCGITGCYTQMMGAHIAMMGAPPNHNIAVLLNLTIINTIPLGSVFNMVDSDLSNFPDKLILQLRFIKKGVVLNLVQAVYAPQNMGGVLPPSNYIVVSNYII